MQKSIVGYARVSTKEQGASGLGLEGQQAAIAAYAKLHGATVVRLYIEVESGRRADRPQLQLAIAHSKRSKATLVVAKLDRLTRNVGFLSRLMESGVDFVACDNPTANKLTIHILAAVAENEAEAISARTKAALTAYKSRGGKLGASLPQCRNLTDVARRSGAKAAGVVVAARANEAYADLAPIMRQLRASGKTQQAIADELNKQGHTTRTGKQWNQVQVKRVLERFAESPV